MKIIGYIAWIGVGVLIGSLVAWALPQHPVGPVKVATTPAATHEPPGGDAALPKVPFAPYSFDEIAERFAVIAESDRPFREELLIAKSLASLSGDELDPDNLVNLLQNARHRLRYDNIVAVLFDRLARKDPELAIRTLERLEHTQLKHVALHGAMGAWAEMDLEAAFAFAESQPSGFIRANAGSIVLNAMAQTDPVGALERALNRENVLFKRGATSRIMDTWVNRDAETAVEYVATLEDREVRAQLLGSTLDAYARKDPEAALAFALDLSKSDNGDFHVRNIISNLANYNTKAAKELFHQVPNDRLDRYFVDGFARSFAMGDLDESLDFSPNIPEGELRDSYLKSALQVASWNDPGRAATLLDRLPGGKHQEDAIDTLMESWVAKDEVAASEWIADQPESPLKDTAASKFAKALFPVDPERALDWADSVRDPEMREHRREKLLGEWKKKNATAAKAWEQGR